MSKQDGVVVVSATLPALGKVKGLVSIAELLGGTAKTDDSPAVTVKDLSGKAPVAPGLGKPAGSAEGQNAAEETQEASDDKPDAPGAGTADSDEEQAERMLKLARNYIDSGMHSLARKKLQELLDKYPESTAAETARKMLGA